MLSPYAYGYSHILGVGHIHPSPVHHVAKEYDCVGILCNSYTPVLPEVEIDYQPRQVGQESGAVRIGTVI